MVTLVCKGCYLTDVYRSHNPEGMHKQTKTKQSLQWHKDGSFSFLKGNRPVWTTDAKKMELQQGEHRRHGLHGAEIITKSCQTLINQELKKSGEKKTHKKLYINLKSRITPSQKLENKGLEALIDTFRRYAFSKVDNLLPGDGDYNKAIEVTRQLVSRIKEKLHHDFFGRGEMPDEVDVTKYKRACLSLLKRKVTKAQSTMKEIVNEVLTKVTIPRVKDGQTILAIDDALTGIIDTAKIDIGFADTKVAKRFNRRVLKMDTRIKRAVVAEEGLSQAIFNTLIGYRPRRRRKK